MRGCQNVFGCHEGQKSSLQLLLLDKERLDPATLDRPDGRPTVRETVPELGNLLKSIVTDYYWVERQIKQSVFSPRTLKAFSGQGARCTTGNHPILGGK